MNGQCKLCGEWDIDDGNECKKTFALEISDSPPIDLTGKNEVKQGGKGRCGNDGTHTRTHTANCQKIFDGWLYSSSSASMKRDPCAFSSSRISADSDAMP